MTPAEARDLTERMRQVTENLRAELVQAHLIGLDIAEMANRFMPSPGVLPPDVEAACSKIVTDLIDGIRAGAVR